MQRIKYRERRHEQARRKGAARRQSAEHAGKVGVTTPQTGANISTRCATVARSSSMASGSRTSPRIRPSATPRAWWRACYDALHDRKAQDKILLPTDTGNGGMTHAFFKAPKSLDDLFAGRDAIAEWAKITYGWMGRSPDYKAAFLATLGANADFYEPYQDNAQALVQIQPGARAVHQSRDHPSAGRSRPAAERSRRRLLPCREGDRRRPHRLRRQGGRHRLGADQLHLRRASRPHSGAGQEIRRRVHGADQCARA